MGWSSVGLASSDVVVSVLVAMMGVVLVPMPEPCVATVMMPAVMSTTTRAPMTEMMMARFFTTSEWRFAAASRTSSGAMGVPVAASPVASSVRE